MKPKVGLLRKKGRAVILFGEDINIKYLIGAEAFCLIIPPNKPAYAISTEMEYERTKKSSSVRVEKIKKGKRLFRHIAMKEKAKNIAINQDYVSVNTHKAIKKAFKGRKFVDVSEEICALRETKDDEEIRKTRQACKITDKIIQELIKNIKKFKTEKQAAQFLTKRTLEEGCELAFPPIIASGKNSSMPHSEPQNKPIKKGFCVIDFGVKFEGYCSDITRTIYKGKPSAHEIKEYDKVLNAQQECIGMLKPGVTCAEVYNHALTQLGTAFTHGLGHGTGIQIHERPNIKDIKEKIKKNTITTIEPGVYYPGKFGIRIEDDILVKDKPEIITKTTRKLITF